MTRIVALLLLPLMFTHCAPVRGRHELSGKPNLDTALAKERWEGREHERAAYDDGSTDGATDADHGAANHYQTHRDRFNTHTEQAYRDGYHEGFSKSGPGTHEATLTNAEQAARDAGYAAGLLDRRRNRGSDPEQHAGTYDAKFSSWFLDGYQEGFK